MQLLDGLLIVLLAICLITDIKSRKIYNNVLLPALFLSLVFQVFLNGWTGLFHSILGLLVGFLILLIPYMMKGMGAGDVKLMAVIGAIQGPLFILTTAVYMAVIGAVVALILIVFRLLKTKQWKTIFHRNSLMTYGMKLAVLRSHSSNQTFPYGVAIVGGACCTLFFQGVIRP